MKCQINRQFRARLSTTRGPGLLSLALMAAVLAVNSVPVPVAADDSELKDIAGVVLPGFLPHQEIPTGSGRAPTQVVLHDLSGDGIPDLAASISTSNQFDNVDVALGVGDGTFSPSVSYGVGSTPNDLSFGDMNRDGHPDLVSCNSESDDVSVLINNGDGTFAPEDFTAVGSFPRRCGIADFDNDGFLDIASSNLDNTVTVLTNEGTGTNYTAAHYSTEFDLTHGRQPFDLVLADFNKDGFPDIAVNAATDDEIVLMYSTGLGTFFTGDFALYIPTGDGPTSIETYDFNGDGWLDVVTSNSGSVNLMVHLNDASGAFPSFGPGLSVATGSWPAGIGLGDHNLDGDIDLVVALPSTDLLQIFLGNGSGGFVSAATIPVGDWPASVAVADVDRDGDPDVATGNYDGFSVSILLNRFNIFFGPPPVARATACSAPGTPSEPWCPMEPTTSKSSERTPAASRRPRSAR